MACVESRYVSLLFDSTSTKKEYREYMSAPIGVGDSIHELDLADWTRGKSALDVAAYVFEIFTKKIIPAQRLLMAHGVFAPRLVTYTWPHMCTFSCTDNENTMPATLAEFEHYRVISHVLFDLVGAVEEIAPVADTHALVLTASSRLADEDAKSLGDLDRPHLRRTPPVPRAVTSSDLTDADDAAATCEIKDRETLALQPHVITFTKKVDKERAEKLAKTDTMLRSRFLAAVRHVAKRAAATAAAAAAAAALHFLTEAATAALAGEAQQTVVGASGGESGDRCADDRHTDGCCADDPRADRCAGDRRADDHRADDRRADDRRSDDHCADDRRADADDRRADDCCADERRAARSRGRVRSAPSQRLRGPRVEHKFIRSGSGIERAGWGRRRRRRSSLETILTTTHPKPFPSIYVPRALARGPPSPPVAYRSPLARSPAIRKLSRRRVAARRRGRGAEGRAPPAVRPDRVHIPAHEQRQHARAVRRHIFRDAWGALGHDEDYKEPVLFFWHWRHLPVSSRRGTPSPCARATWGSAIWMSCTPRHRSGWDPNCQ